MNDFVPEDIFEDSQKSRGDVFVDYENFEDEDAGEFEGAEDET